MAREDQREINGRNRRVTATNRRPNARASSRLAELIESELAQRGLTCQEAAREAKLPADAFRTVLKGRKPNIDRAEELCRALGVTMTIGTTPTGDEATDVAGNEAASGAEQ